MFSCKTKIKKDVPQDGKETATKKRMMIEADEEGKSHMTMSGGVLLITHFSL
jgi:hypothetical protein